MLGLEHTLSRFLRLLALPGGSRSSVGEVHRPGGHILRELVFGANDGLVSNVSLVAAMAGATDDPKTILLGGIAGLVAGTISMALGAYVSTKSEREFREAEERRERWEIDHMPDVERAEIHQIYRQLGLRGETLEAVVEHVTNDKERWLQTMMQLELGFATEAPRPRKAALVMGLAFVVGAAFPVIPYTFTEGVAALALSLGLTAGALVSVGAWRAYLTGGATWVKAGEMLGLATVAVALAYGIGRLVGVGIF